MKSNYLICLSEKNRKTPIGEGEFESSIRARWDLDAEALIRGETKDGQAKEKGDWRQSIDVSGIEEADLCNKALETLAKYANMWNGRLGQLTATENNIKIRTGTVPEHQMTYREGP